MKRHPELQDLSRDHHLFLIHAREIRWGIEGHRHGSPLPAVWSAFWHFWEHDGAPHLQEEEEVLLPYYQAHDPDAQGQVDRVLAEHRWIRPRVAELAAMDTADGRRQGMLAELGRRIHDHVRFEERSVFQKLQAALNPAQLAELGRRSRAFRRHHRSPEAIGPSRSGSR